VSRCRSDSDWRATYTRYARILVPDPRWPEQSKKYRVTVRRNWPAERWCVSVGEYGGVGSWDSPEEAMGAVDAMLRHPGEIEVWLARGGPLPGPVPADHDGAASAGPSGDAASDRRRAPREEAMSTEQTLTTALSDLRRSLDAARRDAERVRGMTRDADDPYKWSMAESLAERLEQAAIWLGAIERREP